MCVQDGLDPRARYTQDLVGAGHLIPLGVPGLFGRGGDFEGVITRFQALVRAEGQGDGAIEVHFPPIFNRAHYCSISHIHNFPDLIGSVHSFTGGEKEHRELVRKFENRAEEDWTRDLTPADSMLVPAACYPLYPGLKGTLPAQGSLYELVGWVFRHEPSDDPARMQIFRQREYVRLGTEDQATAHRDSWMQRARDLLQTVGLDAELVVANDPFFGRGGRMAKASQREQALKYELVVPITSTEKPTAVASCNYHRDYFGLAFDILSADGQPAHTACVGFGLERVALALFKTHGLDTASWPETVRQRLSLS